MDGRQDYSEQSVLVRNITVQDLWNFIYSRNPFYLISTVILLGAACSLFSASKVGTDTLIPLSIIGGYAVLVAATLIFLVRWGKVWEDARSLLMIEVILLLVLSAGSDSEMMDSLETGLIRGIGGLVFAAVLLETTRRMLKIRLDRFFLIPCLLTLASLFLYPVWIAALARENAGLPQVFSQEQIHTHIFVFALTGVPLLLSFLPFILRNNDNENGTPWSRAFFPGCLIWIFAGGLMIRTYLMTLSFIGGRGVGGYTQLESGFHFFMVAPLMLTALILLTEYLLRCGNEKEKKILMWIPGLLVFPALLQLTVKTPDNLLFLLPAALGILLLIWQRIRGIRHGELWGFGMLFIIGRIYINDPAILFSCLGGSLVFAAIWTVPRFRLLYTWLVCVLMLTVWLFLLSYAFNFEGIFTVNLPLLYLMTLCTFLKDQKIQQIRPTLAGFILLYSALMLLSGESTFWYGTRILPLTLLSWVMLLWNRNKATRICFWLYTGFFAAAAVKAGMSFFMGILEHVKFFLVALLFFVIAVGFSLHKARRNRRGNGPDRQASSEYTAKNDRNC